MRQKKLELLSSALRLILRPVIRFCVRNSIKIQDLEETAKELYIELSSNELKKNGTEISLSRLSVMSGMQRRDVKRIQEKSNADPEPAQQKHFLLRVIGQWEEDKRFTTATGKAKVLTVEGAGSEFAELVTSVSKDLNPYTVLFELERIGAVERSSKGIKLLTFQYVPSDAEEKYVMLGNDLYDLVEGVTENIHDEVSEKNLHLTTSFDNIPLESLPEIRKWLRDKGTEFHEVVRKYLSKFDRDIDSGSKRSVLSKNLTRARAMLCAFSRIEVLEDDVEKRESTDG